MASIEVRVPDLGTFKDVAVIELLVKPGDQIEVDASIATLETEKATMDVPSTVSGKVVSLHIARGGTVNGGDLVAIVEGELPTQSAAPIAAAAPAPTAAPVAPQQPAAPAATTPIASPTPAASPITLGVALDAPSFGTAHAGPSVRKLARELGVDLSRVTGSGPKGRISHEDVKAWVKRALHEAHA